MRRFALLSIVMFLNIVCAQETEVDGKLTVTGEIDVSGKRVTNIGAPEEKTDAVNVNYLESKTYRLLDYTTQAKNFQDNKGVVVFHEYEIAENSISEFIRVELEAYPEEWQRSSLYPELLIGLSEEGMESQGLKIMGSPMIGGGSTWRWDDTYNPQVWWNVVLPEEWKNQKLYIKLQLDTDWDENLRSSGGRIVSIFIWGK